MLNEPLQLPAPLVPPADFVERVRELGVEFEPGDVEKLGAFLALMLAVNEQFNLTAITDPTEAWTKHILDAMTLVPLIAAAIENSEDGGGALEGVDIGSGGGVPAIPLAIVLPNVEFTLVEATGKKVEFLRQAAALLGLENVTVVQDRAERLGQMAEKHSGGGKLSQAPWYRDRFDFAMARAVGHLAIVAELCAPLVKPPINPEVDEPRPDFVNVNVDDADDAEGGGSGGGLIFAVKGAKGPQELIEAGKALTILRLEHVTTVETPTGKIVVLEKVGPTSKTYPRKDGEPKRVPLGLPKKDPKERGE